MPIRAISGSILWLLLAVALAGGHQFIVGLPPWVDEIQHTQQIAEFMRGGSAHAPLLTTFATYHWIVAAIARLIGAGSLDSLRLISIVLSTPLVIAVVAAVRQLHGSEASARVRALQVLLLPIMLPYLFLLYTDCLALAAILLATWATLARRYWLAAGLGIFAVMVRQNNIVWLLWLLAFYGYQERIWTDLDTRWQRVAINVLPYLFGFVAFAIFVIVNQGVAMGDKASHPSFRLYDENLFAYLLVAGMVLLPFHCGQVPTVWRFIRAKSWLWWLAGALIAAWFVLGYQATHPYNTTNPAFVHNRLALWLNDPWHRVWVAIPLVWTLISMMIAIADRGRAVLWLGATMLSLAPIWMVEHRYYIVPLALWLCLRTPVGRLTECTLVVWLLSIDVAFVAGVRLSGLYL